MNEIVGITLQMPTRIIQPINAFVQSREIIGGYLLPNEPSDTLKPCNTDKNIFVRTQKA